MARQFSFGALSPLYNTLAVGAIVSLLLWGFLLTSPFKRALTFFAAGIILMIYAESSFSATLNQTQMLSRHDSSRFVCGKAVSVAMKRTDGYHFLVKCDSLYDQQGSSALKGRTIACFSPESIGLGTTALLKGTYRPPAQRSIPGVFDERTYMAANGLWGRFRVAEAAKLEERPSWFDRTNYSFRAVVYRSLNAIADEGHRALLQSAFLGDKGQVPVELETLFRDAGITHLLAISGQNVAVIASAVAALLYFLPLSRRLKVILIISALWWFLFVVGTIPSLFRAVVMATIVLAAVVIQKKSHPVNSLALAVLILLVISPFSLFTAGFQLSFAATFGVIVLFPWLKGLASGGQKGTADHQPGAPSWGDLFAFKVSPGRFVAAAFRESFLISVAAFIATLPIILYQFSTISLIGIAVNLVAVALMTFSMWAMVGGIILQPIVPFLSALFIHTADRFLDLLLSVARLSQQVPYGVIRTIPPIPSVLVIVILFGLGLLCVASKRRIRYVVVGLPILISSVILIALVDGAMAQPHQYRLQTDKGTVTAVVRPGAYFWIAANLHDTLGTRFYLSQLAPLIRSQRCTRADMVIVRERRASLSAIRELVEATRSSRTGLIHDQLPVQADRCFSPDFGGWSKVSRITYGDTLNIDRDCRCIIDLSLDPGEDASMQPVEFRFTLKGKVFSTGFIN